VKAEAGHLQEYLKVMTAGDTEIKTHTTITDVGMVSEEN